MPNWVLTRGSVDLKLLSNRPHGPGGGTRRMNRLSRMVMGRGRHGTKRWSFRVRGGSVSPASAFILVLCRTSYLDHLELRNQVTRRAGKGTQRHIGFAVSSVQQQPTIGPIRFC